MSYRVAKRGTAVLFYLIIAIISALPGFFYMIPFYLAAGLICETILWRPRAYRNGMLNAVTYMIFGIMFSIGSYLPIYLFGDGDVKASKQHGARRRAVERMPRWA